MSRRKWLCLVNLVTCAVATLYFAAHFNRYTVDTSRIKTARLDTRLNNTSYHQPVTDNETVHIAVAGGIYLNHIIDEKADLRKGAKIFTEFLPTFCKTVSVGNFQYHVYFAYDLNDGFFASSKRELTFYQVFSDIIRSFCPPEVNVTLTLVRCSHNKKPAWAQNDAMLAAYLDGNDYFYRINDDTIFTSRGWLERFISTLASYKPQNVGVVGPNHKGGNTAILTYDFVHRTHVEIFGFYYPRSFINWHADRWITEVYGHDRTSKLKDISLHHSKSGGTRYKPVVLQNKIVRELTGSCKSTVARYITWATRGLPSPSNVSKLVIMTLNDTSPRYSWGAIRNAQLAQLYLTPEWELRIYISGCSPSVLGRNVLNTLQSLRVTVVQVACNLANTLDHTLWPFLALGDPTITLVLVRSPLFRLSDHDTAVLNDWLQSDKSVLIVRDQDGNEEAAIISQLWGLKSRKIRDLVIKTGSIEDALHRCESYLSTTDQASHPDVHFLTHYVLPTLGDDQFVFDRPTPSVHISETLGCYNSQFIGQEFDENMQPMKMSV